MKTIERSEMMKTYTLYDTQYKKIKRESEHWYEIHFIPRHTIPAPDPETALNIAKKQGHPLPVIGEEKKEKMFDYTAIERRVFEYLKGKK